MGRHVLLVGAPGSGKTTVVERTVELLRERGVALFGFVTGEIRESGARVGFSIESMAGERRIMAHVDFHQGPRVSRYRVAVEAIVAVAVGEIHRALQAGGPQAVLVMDEIGKMELMSPEFREAVPRALRSDLRVLATAMAAPHPLVDAIKRAPDTEVIRVTPANREALPEQLAARFTSHLSSR